LDGNNNWLEDISTNLVSWSLTRNCTATIHGTGTFVVAQQLQGGWQRVRPYMLLSGAGLSDVRWDLGVYVMTTPAVPLDQSPLTYTIDGSDLLYVLQNPIGDTYTVAAGVSYLTAIEDVFSAASMTGSQLLLDGTAASAVLPAALSWPLTGGQAFAYLDVINQLLAAINYLPLWADWEGNFRSSPYLSPSQLAPEYAFTTQMVADSGTPRTLTNDLWQAPNNWIYINENVDGPVLGAGIYQYTNEGTGQSSVAAVRRVITDVEYVNVVDQPTLVATANQAINQAIQLVEQLAVETSPFPAMWHFDMLTYTDPQLPPSGNPETVTCQSQGWTLPSVGTGCSQTWQIIGAPVV
jgi:hypothetical protein